VSGSNHRYRFQNASFAKISFVVHLVGYERPCKLLKSKQAVIAELSTTISQFKLCFEPDKKHPIIAHKKRKVTLLQNNARPHGAKVVKDISTSMGSLTTLHIHQMCFKLLLNRWLCNMALLTALQNIWRNKKMVRWMDCFEGQTFFLSRNSLITRKVGENYC